ncbi:MAG: hypothetical protein M3436_11910 [Pseudomonadota bacterium]|nr:hypothetical protein [Pseudomonadota bacterium]
MINEWLKKLGRLLCFLGFHDFRVVEVSFAFGGSSGIEKVECRRCGYRTARETPP